MEFKTMMRNKVSPLYLREEKIYVTIIEVKTPVHYVVKESPSMNTASTYALKFLESEALMQKYYGSLEKTFFQIPVKDTILVAEYEKKFYRAKVLSILNLPQSYLIKVFLLDYGKECSVSRSNLYEIHPDFMSIPFQVTDFKLPGLEPISLIMNPLDLQFDYGPSMDWDISASTFIENIRKALHSAFIKVEGVQNNCVFGTLHVTMLDGDEKCVNDELVFKKFAFQNPECWNDIIKLSAILSKDDSQNGSSNSESPDSSPFISKPPLAKELSSQELKPSTKSSVISEVTYPLPAEKLDQPKSPTASVSTVVSEPLKNNRKSSVQKLREILKAKRSQEQNMSSSEIKKEPPPQSNNKQNLGSEVKESKLGLPRDSREAENALNETRNHIVRQEQITITQEVAMSKTKTDSENTFEKTAVKTTEENKSDQNPSPPVSVTAVQKLKKILASKRAAQAQNTSPASNVNPSTDSLSLKSPPKIDLSPVNTHSSESGGLNKRILNKGPAQKQHNLQPLSADSSFLDSQPEMDLSPTNIHLSDMERIDKLIEDLIVSIPTENKRNDSLASTTACKENAKVENLVLQPTSSAIVQNVDPPKVESSVKSNSDKSVESLPLAEQKEVSRKVDPAKIKAFYERHRKARALFLAQNKLKQEQDNANLNLNTIPPPVEPTETILQSVATEIKSDIGSSAIANSETKAEKTDSIKLNLVNEPVDNNESTESQTLSPPIEVTNKRVDPAKIKAFFERSRKARALFLAQAKNNQNQESATSHSNVTLPTSENIRPKIETKSPATSETKVEDKSCGNVSDSTMFDLTNESSGSNSNR